MATKIKNAITNMFCFLGIGLVMLGGSALDSEDIILPMKICLAGITFLFISVLMMNSKSK